MIAPQQCQTNQDSKGNRMNWYRCDRARPPFIGCCSSNPCGLPQGCPKESISAAVLSGNPLYAAVFTGYVPLPASNSTCQAGQGESSMAGAPTPTPTTDQHPTGKTPDRFLGLKIGLPFLVGVILLLLFCHFYRKRVERRRDSEKEVIPVAEPRDRTARRFSIASSTFVRPRPAPIPPLTSLPPVRPLPPVPPPRPPTPMPMPKPKPSASSIHGLWESIQRSNSLGSTRRGRSPGRV